MFRRLFACLLPKERESDYILTMLSAVYSPEAVEARRKKEEERLKRKERK